MNERRPILPETVLSEPAAAQLLARASELDAALKGGTSIATLRAAAAEAGISNTAFDAALIEVQAERPAQVPAVGAQRRRVWSWLAGASLVMLGMATVVVARSPTPTGLIEQSVMVRCLSIEEAGYMIRPYLDRSSLVVARPESRVLRIRATPAQIDRIRAVLDQAERAPRACVSR